MAPVPRDMSITVDDLVVHRHRRARVRHTPVEHSSVDLDPEALVATAWEGPLHKPEAEAAAPAPEPTAPTPQPTPERKGATPQVVVEELPSTLDKRDDSTLFYDYTCNLDQGNDKNYYLSMPDDCAYGWLGDLARDTHCPPGPAYVSLLALYAGQGVTISSGEPTQRATIYVSLVGGVHTGKSVCMERSMRMLGMGEDDNPFVETTVIASDRGLLQTFGGKVEPGAPPPAIIPSKVLVLDEFRELLGKTAVQNSTLTSTLCKLWSGNRAGASDKQGKYAAYVKLSILGNLKADDPSEFAEMFGVSTSSGLYDRFIFAPFPTAWKFDFEGWLPRVETRPPSPTKFTIQAGQMSTAWATRLREEGEDVGRLTEHAKRVALITASANREPEVTPECMAAALRFAEWQRQIRKAYRAGVATTPEAQLTCDIMDAMDRAQKAHEAGQPLMANKHDPIVVEIEEDYMVDGESRTRMVPWVHFRLLATKHGWYKKTGPMVTKVRNCLVLDNIILARSRTGEQHNLRTHTGFYRLRSTC